MVRQDASGNLNLLVDGNYTRRQDAPIGYDVTTLAYVLRSEFILENQRLWDGRVKGLKFLPKEPWTSTSLWIWRSPDFFKQEFNPDEVVKHKLNMGCSL